ncbi:DNA utilization family protein [Zobellella maritima]|uniref:DNA utilization family protein n=1 Tax=Zobellella maritima TaxID=2059725 RepID=UPI000E303EF2|nr:DNA utilization family protein [Zobellella maritima]
MNSLLGRLLIITLPALLALPADAQPNSDNGTGQPAYPPLDSFQEIIVRPLFDDRRRPRQTEDSDDTSETAAALKEKWRLTGVVWKGEQQLALLSQRRGEARLRLEAGMYLDGGWQLEEIQAEAVILTDGEQQLLLELREPRRLPEPESITKPDPQQEKPEQHANTKAATEINNDNQG